MGVDEEDVGEGTNGKSETTDNTLEEETSYGIEIGVLKLLKRNVVDVEAGTLLTS